MLQQLSLGAGEQGVEDVLLALEAETAAYGGRLTKARELSRRTITSAQNAGEKETAATYGIHGCRDNGLYGSYGAAGSATAIAFLKSPPSRASCARIVGR
jgi:hypothetical protein